ncbi:alkaline phosphatase [Alteromonas mediterranea]|uniref:alkaline phosphatase D family protein n=1 Tax=Alteromonas mediterranea TaxID=314275 RepID=UPI0011313816|nr:alkaline phosphatase D family protein [Alteromonas mediterranea]QDG36224.1 alkaline phosphatase [Alteromonas mediterranea]
MATSINNARRQFFKSLGLTASVVGFQASASPFNVINTPYKLDNERYFKHGVASGDPLPNAVILWTRVSAVDAETPVTLYVAKDEAMTSLVLKKNVTTTEQRDYTVKVDVTGLTPDTTYYYQFEVNGFRSRTGTTKTAPLQANHARFAVVSCSNYPEGFFNVYHALTNTNAVGSVDAVLHLGDYLYEYAEDEYGDGSRLGRAPLPDKEITTLSDYRTRHAQYKTDQDLALLHASYPFITVWDDHEITNDAHRTGAENHNEGEGDYQLRKSYAIKAYYEWMPIREGSIYRHFAWGELLDLYMLDTRIEGRDAQVDTPVAAERYDTNRTLLGNAQERWLLDNLSTSTASWRFLGQQVMFGQFKGINAPNLEAAGIPLTKDIIALNMDQWDGYPEARQRILDVIKAYRIENTVVLTGDIHTSWGMEIFEDSSNGYTYNDRIRLGEQPLAVEFVTPSVTSPGLSDPVADPLATFIPTMNPHMKYVELKSHGFMIVDVTHQKVTCDWWYVDTIESAKYKAFLAKSLYTINGSQRLSEHKSIGIAFDYTHNPLK